MLMMINFNTPSTQRDNSNKMKQMYNKFHTIDDIKFKTSKNDSQKTANNMLLQ